jgi:hypothetical protein
MQLVPRFPSCIRPRIAQAPPQLRLKRGPGSAGIRLACALLAVGILSGICPGQSTLPFQVSNPKHKKWPPDEATRLYFSACELAARAIRPEKPPHLQPKFVLVLGAKDDEAVRNGSVSEIHLKNWEPERFAEAVVVMAVRDVLSRDRVADLVHNAVISSEATVSVTDFKPEQ